MQSGNLAVLLLKSPITIIFATCEYLLIKYVNYSNSSSFSGHTASYLLTLPLFVGVSRVRALSPAWTGSHARETLISRTHIFLPHDIPPTKNQVQ